MAKSSPLNRGIGGKLKSARAKIGGACSQAMSSWKKSGMTPAIAKILGECRSRARLLNRAADQRNAGREGMAANLEKRAQGQYVTQKDRLARAQELRAKRREKVAGGQPVATPAMTPYQQQAAQLAKREQAVRERYARLGAGGKQERASLMERRYNERLPVARQTLVENREYRANQKRVQASVEDRRANRLKRNTKNTQYLRDYLSKGGQAVLASQTKPRLMNSPGLIKDPSPKTGELRVITGYQRDKSPIVSYVAPGDQTRALVRDARAAAVPAARERLQQMRAERAKRQQPTLPSKLGGMKQPHEMSQSEWAKYAEGGKLVPATGKFSPQEIQLQEEAKQGFFRSAVDYGRAAGYSEQDIAHHYLARSRGQDTQGAYAQYQKDLGRANRRSQPIINQQPTPAPQQAPSLREQAAAARAKRQYIDGAGLRRPMSESQRVDRARYLRDLRKEGMGKQPSQQYLNSTQDINWRLGVAYADRREGLGLQAGKYGSVGNRAARRLADYAKRIRPIGEAAADKRKAKGTTQERADRLAERVKKIYNTQSDAALRKRKGRDELMDTIRTRFKKRMGRINAVRDRVRAAHKITYTYG